MKAGIVGDGIMGQLMAFSLVNAGWKVTLFGSEDQHNCSMAAAGLLTPVAELEKNDVVIFQLGLDSLNKHWPVILAEVGQEVYFRQLGSLLLSHPKDRADLTRFMQIIATKLCNQTDYRLLNNEQITVLEPDLARFSQGYYFPQEGQLDNQFFLRQLSNYNNKKNVTRLNLLVKAVQPGKVVLQDSIIHFDLTLDCRGLGAKEIFSDLRGVRGELIWLYAPDVSISRPVRFLHPRYSLYLAPRPNSIYLLGASEIESNDDSPISVRTMLELLTAAYCVQPNFAEARIIKTMTQRRPTLFNHLPRIKYADNFIAVNGLYRHGFLIAPALMVEIMQWLQYGLAAVNYPELFEQV